MGSDNNSQRALLQGGIIEATLSKDKVSLEEPWLSSGWDPGLSQRSPLPLLNRIDLFWAGPPRSLELLYEEMK